MCVVKYHHCLKITSSLIVGVSKCLQEQCWVDETPYEVQGVTVGESTCRLMITEAPRKGRENASQKVSHCQTENDNEGRTYS